MKEFSSITIKDLIEELKQLPQDAKIGTLTISDGEAYATEDVGLVHKDYVNFYIPVDMQECDYFLY